MVEKFPQHKIYPYSGSQNSTVHPVLLDAKDVVYSDNLIYTLSSTKKLRPGLKALFQTQKPSGVDPILASIDFHFWDSANARISQRFVYFQGGSVKAYDPLSQTTSIIKSDLPASSPVCFEAFFGLLIMCVGNKTTIPQKWDGTGLMSDLYSDGSTYTPTICRKFFNRLWIDDPTIPGRAYGSKTSDPTDFSDADAKTVDFNINDGDPDGLTAFMPPKDGVMYVGKRHSLFSLTPTLVSSDYVFVPKEVSTGADLGCISHNGCTSGGGYTWFPSERGYHRLVSSDVIIGIDTQFASFRIQNDWISNVGMQNSQFISAIYSPEYNSIMVIYPRQEDEFAKNLLGYSLTSDDWYFWDDFNQSSISIYTDHNTKKRKTVFLSNTGDIGFLSDSVSTDYGKKITMKIKSGIITPSTIPDSKYSFKYANFVYTPSAKGSFDFHFRVNGKYIEKFVVPITQSETIALGSDDFVLAMANLGGLNSVQMFSQKLKGDGTFYDFLIVYTPKDANDSFELIGMFIDADPIDKSFKTIGG